MPAQYSGMNKVGNVPMKMRKGAMGSAPAGRAMATKANDPQSNSGIGAGGTTQVGTAGGRAQIGGQANGIGSNRVGGAGAHAIPGTSMKRFGAGRATAPRADADAVRSTATARPFNAMKQKALAMALRKRNAEPYSQGDV